MLKFSEILLLINNINNKKTLNLHHWGWIFLVDLEANSPFNSIAFIIILLHPQGLRGHLFWGTGFQPLWLERIDYIAKIKRLSNYSKHKLCLQATLIFWGIIIGVMCGKSEQKAVSFFLMTFQNLYIAYNMTHLGYNAWWIYSLTRAILLIWTSNSSSTKCNPSLGLCWLLEGKINFYYLNKSRHLCHPHLWKGLTMGLSSAIAPLSKEWIRRFFKIQ